MIKRSCTAVEQTEASIMHRNGWKIEWSPKMSPGWQLEDQGFFQLSLNCTLIDTLCQLPVAHPQSFESSPKSWSYWATTGPHGICKFWDTRIMQDHFLIRKVSIVLAVDQPWIKPSITEEIDVQCTVTVTDWLIWAPILSCADTCVDVWCMWVAKFANSHNTPIL